MTRSCFFTINIITYRLWEGSYCRKRAPQIITFHKTIRLEPPTTQILITGCSLLQPVGFGARVCLKLRLYTCTSLGTILISRTQPSTLCSGLAVARFLVPASFDGRSPKVPWIGFWGFLLLLCLGFVGGRKVPAFPIFRS